MKKLLFLLCLAAAVTSGFAEVSVKSIEAHQRYPWNGMVDIFVTVQGASDNPEIMGCSFVATNSLNDACISVRNITQSGSDSVSWPFWTRHYIWNAAEDIGNAKIDDLMLSVSIKELGVQLWAGGPYWTECNVGANQPEDSGYYFWWGDTVGYVQNSSSNGWVSVATGESIDHFGGICTTLEKSISDLMKGGYVSSSVGDLMEPHDAARAHLGAPWRMPEYYEFEALKNNCTCTWTTRNGVWGCHIVGRGEFESNSIFLPAAGAGHPHLEDRGVCGHYWSARASSSSNYFADDLYFSSHYLYLNGSFRDTLEPVRALRDSSAEAIIVSCPCKTTHLSVDCRTGARACDPNGEFLYFDVDWNKYADRMRITDNGVILTNGTSGVLFWRPSQCSSPSHKFVLEAYGLWSGNVYGSESVEFTFEPTLEHAQLITKPAIEPTSTTSGVSAEIVCARCGELLQEARTIPALGYIRNLSVRQLWPFQKLEVCYLISDDIYDVAGVVPKLSFSCNAEVTTNEVTILPRIINDSEYQWLRSGTQWTSAGRGVQNLQGSYITTIVSNATNVSFRWKVSSEAGYDFLRFCVDDVEVTPAISGETEWRTVNCNLTSGRHILKWSYTKDQYVDGGSDYGCVDQIQVTKTSEIWSEAESIIGDDSMTPGYHCFVWDCEKDGVLLTERLSAKAEALYCLGSQTVRSEQVSTVVPRIDVGQGLPVSGCEAVGYTTAFGSSTKVYVDEDLLLSSTNDGKFVWQPKRVGNYVFKHISGTNVWSKTVNVEKLDIATPKAPNPPGDVDLTLTLGMDRRDFASAERKPFAFTVASTEVGKVWSATVSDDWISLTDASGVCGTDMVTYYVDANTNAAARTGYVYVNGHVHTVVQPGLGATLQMDPLLFDCNGTEKTVAVGAAQGVHWDVSPEVEWITILPTSGDGPGMVTLRAAPYVYFGSRTGTAKIAGNVVSFAQNGCDMQLSHYVTNCTAAATSLSVGVCANDGVSWSVVPQCDWIMAEQSGARVGDGDVILSVGVNTGHLTRTGVVMIGTEAFKIIQGPSASHISISRIDCGPTGGDFDVVVYVDAGVQWAVSNENSWVAFDGASSRVGPKTVTFHVTTNINTVARSGMLRVAGFEVTVEQSSADVALSTSLVNLEPSGGSATINVTAPDYLHWDVGELPAWVSLASGETHTGSDSLTFEIAQNSDGGVRSCEARIGGRILTIRQSVATTTVASNRILHGSDYDLGSVSVSAPDYLAWTVSTTNDWIKLIGLTNHTGGASIEYIVYELDSVASRIGIIWVGNTPVYVCQCAGVTELASYTGEVSCVAGSGHVAVTLDGSVSWCAVSAAPWIRLTKSTGINGEAVLYTYEANVTGSERVGRILIDDQVFTLTQTNVDPSAPAWSIVYENLKGAANQNPSKYFEGYGLSFSPLSNVANFTFAGWTPASIALDATGDKVVTANWNWIPQDAAVEAAITGGKELKIKAEWAKTELNTKFGAGKAAVFCEKFGGDFAAALMKKTGKRDGSGKELEVWHDYVAGTDPTDSNSVFTAKVRMEGGFPVIEWEPNLNENGEERVYTVFGKADLKDAWHSPTNGTDRFFKVSVAMPEGNVITLSLGGGSCDADPLVVSPGDPLGTLPEPTRDGYVFDGWYTSEEGGDKVTAQTIAVEGMTIYARWKNLGEGLVHRWSFNGNLNDLVGSLTAVAVGSVTAGEKQYTLAGGTRNSSYIDLGDNILPTGANGATIELWATRRGAQKYSRVIDIGSKIENYLFWSWQEADSVDNDSCGVYALIGTSDRHSGVPFVEDKEYHLSIAIKPVSTHWEVVYVKRDVSTGSVVSTVTISSEGSSWTPKNLGQSNCWLGHSQWGDNCDACASYNEVRIWNRALTDDELTKSAKAGPDNLVL